MCRPDRDCGLSVYKLWWWFPGLSPFLLRTYLCQCHSQNMGLEPWSELEIGHGINSLDLDTGWLLRHPKITSVFFFFFVRGILVGYQDSYASVFFPHMKLFVCETGCLNPSSTFYIGSINFHLVICSSTYKDLCWISFCHLPSVLSLYLSQSSVCCQNHRCCIVVGESQLRSLSWGECNCRHRDDRPGWAPQQRWHWGPVRGNHSQSEGKS